MLIIDLSKLKYQSNHNSIILCHEYKYFCRQVVVLHERQASSRRGHNHTTLPLALRYTSQRDPKLEPLKAIELTVKRRGVLQRAGQRDLGSRMFVYHCLGDIVLSFRMRAPMLAPHPAVVLPPLLGPKVAATLLLPLQRHLVGVHRFTVRERVVSLPPPGRLGPSPPHHHARRRRRRGVVDSARDLVSSFAPLQGLQRVLVAAVKRQVDSSRVVEKGRKRERRKDISWNGFSNSWLRMMMTGWNVWNVLFVLSLLLDQA